MGEMTDHPSSAPAQTTLITGASGFVGQAAVRAARAKGHAVIALYRRTLPEVWANDPGITPLQLDLSAPDAPEALRAALVGVDGVIHAAAHLGEDAQAIRSDTAQGTAHLLQALDGHPARLVLVSSIAVYDTSALSPGATVTEDSPLVDPTAARDPYSASKRAQEIQVSAARPDHWALRPGAIYGPDRTWHALMGFWASKVFVLIDGGGPLPLCHVDHVGQALVAAAETPVSGTIALNVIDDDCPTRTAFVRSHKRLAGWPRLVLPVPYGLWLGLARALRPLGHRLPGLLREPILRARLMPLSYPNARLRARLGGQDAAPFDDMLARSLVNVTV